MEKLVSVILLACLISARCSTDSVYTEIDKAQTKAVLDHHWETFLSNDLDGVMEGYSAESILITPNGIYSGLEEIRGNFVNAFKAFLTQGAILTLNNSLAVEDIGYSLWEEDTLDFNLTYATDTFIIRNGNIIRQTFAGVRVAKGAFLYSGF